MQKQASVSWLDAFNWLQNSWHSYIISAILKQEVFSNKQMLLETISNYCYYRLSIMLEVNYFVSEHSQICGEGGRSFKFRNDGSVRTFVWADRGRGPR